MKSTTLYIFKVFIIIIIFVVIVVITTNITFIIIVITTHIITHIVLLSLPLDGSASVAGGGYSLLSLNLPQVFWALVLGNTPGLYDIAGFDAELHQVTVTVMCVIGKCMQRAWLCLYCVALDVMRCYVTLWYVLLCHVLSSKVNNNTTSPKEKAIIAVSHS